MPATMAFFIPSYIQKRLLHYALTRLELLDSDALNLENLDVALGKRSTIELRDIGLRLPVRSFGRADEAISLTNRIHRS